MGAVRDKLLSQAHAPEAHKPLFEKLINAGLLRLIKNKDIETIDRLLLETLGPGFKFGHLIDKDR